MAENKCPKCGAREASRFPPTGEPYWVTFDCLTQMFDGILQTVAYRCIENQMAQAFVQASIANRAIEQLPSIDQVKTALAANRSMIDGQVVRQEEFCQCDAEVGAAPCEYCAVHAVLAPVYRVLVARSRETAPGPAMCQPIDRLGRYADTGQPIIPGDKMWIIDRIIANYPEEVLVHYITRQGVKAVHEGKELPGLILFSECYQIRKAADEDAEVAEVARLKEIEEGL